MQIKLHPHALERLIERGATQKEVFETVSDGETFSAKHGRTGFRRNFYFDGKWNGKIYKTKQIEVYVVKEASVWLVITVIVKFF